MENIIIVNFDVESESFQALSELKARSVTNDYVVSQAVIAKKAEGSIKVLDGFDTGAETSNDTAIGGLIGSLLGIAGGPLGMVIMGGYGALIGSAVDWSDAAQNASLMEYVLSCVAEDKAVLIVLVQENVSGSFDSVFDKFGAEITRFDAAEVAAEVDEAARVQEEMAKRAKKELREAKKNDRKQAIAERRSKIASHFAEIGSKFKK